MAIALDTDFRGLLAPQAPDGAARRGAEKGKGEDFAESLLRVRDETSEGAAPSRTESAILASQIPLPVLGTPLPAGGGLELAVADPELGSTLVSDSLDSGIGELSDGRLLDVSAEILQASTPVATPPERLTVVAEAAQREYRPSPAALPPSTDPALTVSPLPTTSPHGSEPLLPALPASATGMEAARGLAPSARLAPGTDRGSPSTDRLETASTQDVDRDAVAFLRVDDVSNPAETPVALAPTPDARTSAAGSRGSLNVDEEAPVPAPEPVLANTSLQTVSGLASALTPAGNTPVAASSGAPAPRAAASPEIRAAKAASEDRSREAIPISTDAVLPNLTQVADPQPVSEGRSETVTTLSSLASAAPATTQITSAAMTSAPPAPTVPQPFLVAAPADVVAIVAQSAEDGQSDRVVIQLDPPELGRVSIDFKFDAQGVQHITITSETPEAMRQLRQMHGELVQALERQGIGSQNMSFQHQQQNPRQDAAPAAFARLSNASNDDIQSVPSVSEPRTSPLAQRLATGGRLDIKA